MDLKKQSFLSTESETRVPVKFYDFCTLYCRLFLLLSVSGTSFLHGIIIKQGAIDSFVINFTK